MASQFCNHPIHEIVGLYHIPITQNQVEKNKEHEIGMGRDETDSDLLGLGQRHVMKITIGII